MPAHTHTKGSAASSNASAGDAGGNAVQNDNTGSTGNGAAHNNMQPSAVVLKIIKI